VAGIEREPMKSTAEILIGPKNRADYLRGLLHLDALDGLQENANAAYCAVSLTNTPEKAKPFVRERQNQVKEILEHAGISSYDPGTAPLSPDLNLSAGPAEIYKTDLARIAGARFFTAFDTFPSTGVGVEIEAARRYNRIPVIFHDTSIRTSRMQPDCAIHVTITDIDEQAERLSEMFKMLKGYEPGRGLVNKQPALLGFKDGKAEHLTDVIQQQFPELAYTFDGTKPALQFGITNQETLFTRPKQ